MDFVDVRPTIESIVDYSWTTTSDLRPIKRSRKQNRCCDQCRKGKRACDAAILEDSLQDPSGSTASAFHYSDAFGALARCGNCQKRRKTCTFEWLRSQRLSQAMGNMGNDWQELLNATPQEAVAPGLSPAPPAESLTKTQEGIESDIRDTTVAQREDHDDDKIDLLDWDLEQGSSMGTISDTILQSPWTARNHGILNATSNDRKSNGALLRTRKRKRRGSSETAANGPAGHVSLSLANKLLSSTTNVFLTEGLLKIYHDSFENALSCWLVEKTCPYSKGSSMPIASTGDPDVSWNRIYHRVFRLDRLASPVRGRNLNLSGERTASRALNLAVFSFATQWAQSSKRSRAIYPFASDTPIGSDIDPSSIDQDFDRKLQISAWHEARMALHDAADIESFRVVLAQIVFSLTQRPTTRRDEQPGIGSPHSCVKEVNEYKDLSSQLELALNDDGPPIHLEQGLRLVHSLRSRLALSGSETHLSHCLDSTDQDTVDLLFWLGVMFDTLSSAIHKRPLVVSDEDSDVYGNDARTAPDMINEQQNRASNTYHTIELSSSKVEGLWDDFLFARQNDRLQGPPLRWPCSHDQAASLLRDAAPVKVLLFRKITRIQSLLSRKVRGLRIEKAIAQAVEVYNWWGAIYAPFIRDSVEYHDDLPAQIQSWYICLTGHWHLATLLLADLLDIIDGSSPVLGEHSESEKRKAVRFAATLREKNCNELSDLARCACPREDASFHDSREFHFAVKQGALLTEPWTAVLIRAFAKAGALLLQSVLSFDPNEQVSSNQEAFRRAEDCCQALFYLGKKSDQALSAAKILSDTLYQRHTKLAMQVHDPVDILETELWGGFDIFNTGLDNYQHS